MVNISLSASVANSATSSKSSRDLMTWAPALAFGLYAAALIVLGARHEAWFDEAQAWLIARDATPWEIIAHYGRYEGTPPLWHLILWAPAHFGYPYRYLWLLSSALALVGAAAVLFRSPFPHPVRWGILLGYFFSYQFAVVARSYALDLALFPLLAILFEKRLDRPLAYCGLLALLANANTHSFLVSGVLGLEYAVAAVRSGRWTQPRILAGAGLYGSFVLAAVAATWPPKDVSFYTYTPDLLRAMRAAMLMAEPFVERVDIWGQAEPSVMSRGIGLVLTLFLLIPSMVLFSHARTRAVFLGAFGVFFVFTTAKYGQAWHAGILFMVWVFTLWISWGSRDRMSPHERTALFASLLVILGVQAWYSVAAWSKEISGVYSPGEPVVKAIADYRTAHPGATVAAVGVKNFAIQPWAAKNLFDNYEGGAAKPAFFDWRNAQPFMRFPTIATWEQVVATNRSDVLLLSDFEAVDGSEHHKFYEIASRAGLCARDFRGQMVWKTYGREPQDIAMFTRCGR
jgi:hypothetical protein